MAAQQHRGCVCLGGRSRGSGRSPRSGLEVAVHHGVAPRASQSRPTHEGDRGDEAEEVGELREGEEVEDGAGRPGRRRSPRRPPARAVPARGRPSGRRGWALRKDGGEDRQVADQAEQADADREAEVLVVEDPVLLLVVAAVAAADQRVGGEVGLDRFVVADPVLGRVDLRHRARRELVDDGAERARGDDVDDADQDDRQRRQSRHRPRPVGDEDGDADERADHAGLLLGRHRAADQQQDRRRQ